MTISAGDKFGRLTVLSRGNTKVFPSGGRKYTWNCVCDCGNNTNVLGSHLKSGHTQSCGCLLVEKRGTGKIKHNLSKTPGYDSYQAMLSRCYGTTELSNKYYISRGITVCDRWLEKDGQGLINFLEDMGYPPENFSLDRINPDGDYCKENCRWVNKSLSAFNTRLRENNTSGRSGVSWVERLGKWRARITHQGIEIHLGIFSSFEEACSVREIAELEYFGETKV